MQHQIFLPQQNQKVSSFLAFFSNHPSTKFALLTCLLIYIIPVMQGGSLQAKQQYLREKIIDAGHDPEQFVEFCSTTHNLDDLENWSLHELIEIVQAFLKHIDPQSHKKQHLSLAEPPLHQNLNNWAVGEGKEVNAGDGKMGLVLTEDDWSILLSAPSVVASKTDQKQENNQQNPLFSMDFGFPLLDPKGQKVEPASKDSPLSPPSTMQKQTTSAPVVSQPQRNESNEVSLKQHVRMDKKGEKRGTESSAINLSNIVITTAKEKSLLPLPNIQEIAVSKTEQVARNFLQGDYTLYHITFSPCQHTIQRKFSDFVKMRAILRRLYPFLRLPHLESEGWLGSSQGKDPETLSRYKVMLQQFMRFMLLRSDELKHCEVVRFFCGLTKKEYSKEEFRKKLEAYEAVPRPKFVGEVVLTNNTITIPPTAPADKFCIATSSLVAEIDVQYQRLRRQLEVLFSNYELLVKSYSDIGSTLSTVQSLLSRHFSDHHQGKQFGAFASLQGMVTRMSNKIVEQAEMFRSRIRTLFRYERDNMATLREVIDYSSSIHHEFNRQGSPPLSANKVRAGSMEIDSPVPLQDPVRNNKGVLSVQQIFWSFAVRREVGRYWELLRRKINESLTLIAYDQLDAQNENLNFWNGIIKRCVL